MSNTVLPYTANAIFNAQLTGAGDIPHHIGWGTGTGTFTRASTGLFTEASEARVEGTESLETIAQTDDTFVITGTMTADGSKTIRNAGVFDDATAGNAFILSDFSGIPLTVGQTIAFVFKVQGL